MEKKDMLFKTKLKKNLLLTLIAVFGLLLFAACSGDSGSTNNNNAQEPAAEEESEHEHEVEEGEHDDEDHDHSEDRIPNPNGAAITLLSPADGATFAEGDEITVEVQVENFALGENDNHWHVYVDGTSWGMVMGGNTSETLRGVEPGEHQIEVYIAGGDHIEFQEGDSATITVE
jgi:hypothetical protein